MGITLPKQEKIGVLFLAVSSRYGSYLIKRNLFIFGHGGEWGRVLPKSKLLEVLILLLMFKHLYGEEGG